MEDNHEDAFMKEATPTDAVTVGLAKARQVLHPGKHFPPPMRGAGKPYHPHLTSSTSHQAARTAIEAGPHPSHGLRPQAPWLPPSGPPPRGPRTRTRGMKDTAPRDRRSGGDRRVSESSRGALVAPRMPVASSRPVRPGSVHQSHRSHTGKSVHHRSKRLPTGRGSRSTPGPVRPGRAQIGPVKLPPPRCSTRAAAATLQPKIASSPPTTATARTCRCVTPPSLESFRCSARSAPPEPNPGHHAHRPSTTAFLPSTASCRQRRPARAALSRRASDLEHQVMAQATRGTPRRHEAHHAAVGPVRRRRADPPPPPQGPHQRRIPARPRRLAPAPSEQEGEDALPPPPRAELRPTAFCDGGEGGGAWRWEEGRKLGFLPAARESDAEGGRGKKSFLRSCTIPGKIKTVALTNFDTERLQIILENGIPIVSNQVQHSIVDMRPQKKMAELCQLTGVKLITYGTVMDGLLSEKFLDTNVSIPFAGPPLNTPSLQKYKRMVDAWGGWSLFQALLQTLKKVSLKHGVPISTVAVRYILDQTSMAGSMVGVRLSLTEHIRDTNAILLLELDEEDMGSIVEASRRGRNLMDIIGDCGDEYRA